ncbi:MAG TPA: class I SAM-dependent methyltransferase [Pseudolabrys sp.]|nr:class I SAM-dependent methyltransferase [Pseudolabrys sp.]
MSEVFGGEYARAYDALYAAKDYAREVDLIERIIAADAGGGRRRVLDLGCGTGNHALPLARRGHTVVGVDRSAAMLQLARAKASATPSDVVSPRFHQGDIRHVDLGERFDAVLMMFTVLGYQTAQADLIAALQTVRRHLENGGLFIFDVWNGLAVMADKPRDRALTVTDGSASIVRQTRVRLDVEGHLCHVHFDLRRTDDAAVEEWAEDHAMRFYFPDELAQALSDCGLSLLRFRSFPDYDAPPDEKAWNIIGVARG